MCKSTITIIFTACAVLIFSACNVGSVLTSDGGQGGSGKDSGGGLHEDGGIDGGVPSDGGGQDGEFCPKIAVAYPCETTADCQPGWVCQPIFVGRPECGSGCVESSDGGTPDAGQPDGGTCVGEGGTINKTGNPTPPQCCTGLDALKQLAVDPAGGCSAPHCDCVVCTQPCGNGDCSTGKNSCNCPQDCPASIPGGPGSKCASDADCKGGASCLTEKSGYPTGGYCAGPVCDLFGGAGQCAAGAICLPMDFSQASGLCMKACTGDSDCRQGLTCEAMPISQRYMGTPYFCWQSGAGGLGKGLGAQCKDGTECITRDCEPMGGGGVSICTQFCATDQPCKNEQVCATSTRCTTQPPDCGVCVYPVK